MYKFEVPPSFLENLHIISESTKHSMMVMNYNLDELRPFNSVLSECCKQLRHVFDSGMRGLCCGTVSACKLV